MIPAKGTLNTVALGTMFLMPCCIARQISKKTSQIVQMYYQFTAEAERHSLNAFGATKTFKVILVGSENYLSLNLSLVKGHSIFCFFIRSTWDNAVIRPKKVITAQLIQRTEN